MTKERYKLIKYRIVNELWIVIKLKFEDDKQ